MKSIWGARKNYTIQNVCFKYNLHKSQRFKKLHQLISNILVGFINFFLQSYLPCTMPWIIKLFSIFQRKCHIFKLTIELTLFYWKVMNAIKDYMKRLQLDLTYSGWNWKPTKSGGIIRYCWVHFRLVIRMVWLWNHAWLQNNHIMKDLLAQQLVLFFASFVSHNIALNWWKKIDKIISFVSECVGFFLNISIFYPSYHTARFCFILFYIWFSSANAFINSEMLLFL